MNHLERYLVLEDLNREAWVRYHAFTDALRAEENCSGGEPISRDEERNGKRIAYLRIHAFLECIGQDGRGERGNHGWRNSWQQAEEAIGGMHVADRGNRRRRSVGLQRPKIGSTSESDDRMCRVNRGHRIKWAVRKGTVEQWLQDVASSMVSVWLGSFPPGNPFATIPVW